MWHFLHYYAILFDRRWNIKSYENVASRKKLILGILLSGCEQRRYLPSELCSFLLNSTGCERNTSTRKDRYSKLTTRCWSMLTALGLQNSNNVIVSLLTKLYETFNIEQERHCTRKGIVYRRPSGIESLMCVVKVYSYSKSTIIWHGWALWKIEKLSSFLSKSER